MVSKSDDVDRDDDDGDGFVVAVVAFDDYSWHLYLAVVAIALKNCSSRSWRMIET
jgi:hypothetical protein